MNGAHGLELTAQFPKLGELVPYPRHTRSPSRIMITLLCRNSVAALVLAVAVWPTSGFADGLLPYQVIDGEIPAPLGGLIGDPVRGREISAGREGNCLACHNMPIPEQQFHGDVGPDLTGVATRLTEGEIRLRLIDPKQISDQTVMPSFYKVDGLTRVGQRYRGKTILTAVQIEDVVAYLLTLNDD